ncbi:MAG: bifunctional phosphoribosylaminoimidazolecarboxamide formyltransferase/IMP cyclohydrolase [Halobacteria archaeon]
MKIVGLTSGEGRNLRHINDLGFDLVGVASDRGCTAVDILDGDDVSVEVFDREKRSKEEFEEDLSEFVAEHEPDLVALDGFNPILTQDFVTRYGEMLVSVHSSLLPAFNVSDPWKAALDAGVSVTGCTVHHVTEEIGEGEIVTQEPVRVKPDDDRESLKERIARAERRAYPRALRILDSETESAADEEGDSGGELTRTWTDSLDKKLDLRYGENPHQDAAFYHDDSFEGVGIGSAEKLGGKDLSFNNVNDTASALEFVREFDKPAAIVVKHTNPCGAAVADSISTAYTDALETDEMSAFGGIVALNRECNLETAESITDSFKEVVIAPGYTEQALDQLRTKEKLRILDVGDLDVERERWNTKKVEGGLLVQERDDLLIGEDDLEIVTETEPTEEQVRGLLFSYTVVKHVKSNGIVLGRASENGAETVGIGAGQMSRVDSVNISCDKAVKEVEGSVLASDAFFPFRDNIDLAAENGISAIIQPGGSVNDDEVIEACDEHGIAMALTGKRCFRH